MKRTLILSLLLGLWLVPASAGAQPNTKTKSKPSPPKCDELGCLLSNHRRPCCDRFKRPPRLGERPTIAAIRRRLRQVESRLQACIRRRHARDPRRVSARFSILAKGNVAWVRMRRSISLGLRNCVRRVLKATWFPRSRFGRTVTMLVPVGPGLPMILTPADIHRGMARVRGRLGTCRRYAGARVKVVIRVRVASSGRVTRAAVQHSGGAALDRCVLTAVRHARFDPTQRGATFSFPILYGGTARGKRRPGRSRPAGHKCNEVDCIITAYKDICCQQFRRHKPPLRPTRNLPRLLTRAQVLAGLSRANPHTRRCRRWHNAKQSRSILVKITIRPNGFVGSVMVRKGDRRLGTCVRNALKQARFAATTRGRTITVPLRMLTRPAQPRKK